MAARGHANRPAYHRQMPTLHHSHRIPAQRHQKRLVHLPSGGPERNWRGNRLDYTVSRDQRVAN